ncbi:MAG: PAS domain S-box protein [Acidobacteriota bacterium]
MHSALPSTFGSLADAFIVTDDHWRIIYANPAAERYGEMVADKLLGGTPWDQWPPAERGRVEQEHRRALDEKQPVELRRSSGAAEDQWSELRACSSEIGIILHYHDLTDQKRREHELSERTRQLSDFMDNGTLALHWVAEDGTILWVNDAELRLLGYSREEYVGRNIAEFHIEQPVIFDILRRLKRNEELREYESRLRCKNGSIKNVSINSSVYWENGRFVHTRCFTRDISESEKASELREHLASIVDSSDDAIISKDLDGIIRSWNRGAERIFGYTAQEIIGKHISTLAAPERVDEIPGILDQIKRGERFDHYETKRRTKDGRILTVSLTVSPIRDASGTVVGASKVARDMTERQLQEQLLREMNATLSRSNADLEQFAYSASHDLQEPLRMVSSYSEMLRKKLGTKLGEPGDVYIGYIIEGVSRMEQLLQDLRSYAQASTADQSASAVADAEVAFEKALVSLQPPSVAAALP